MTTTETTKQPAPARILKQVKVLRHLATSERTGEGEREAAMHRLAVFAAKYLIPDENGVMPTGDTVRQRAEGEPYLYSPGAWMGAKYTEVRGLTLTQIAARIREDLKLARKVGKRTAPKPGEVAMIDPLGDAPAQIKISIRTEYYAGGGAIRVLIKNIPAEWAWTDEEHPRYPGERVKQATPAMVAFYRAVEEIHNAYNYDNSDAMTDYFDRRYWGHVDTEEHIYIPRW